MIGRAVAVAMVAIGVGCAVQPTEDELQAARAQERAAFEAHQEKLRQKRLAGEIEATERRRIREAEEKLRQAVYEAERAKYMKLSDVELVIEAEKAIKALLKDPYSAKFADEKLVTLKDGSRAYCVSVNSKNGFGAYVGYRKAKWLDGNVQFWRTSTRPDRDALMNSLIESVCGN